jgi:hypothetical protein
MLRYEPYFIKNGVAVVAVNRDPTRKLPEPWPYLTDGSWEYGPKSWLEVFTEFLMLRGESPSNFELHWQDGDIQQICWCPYGKCWSLKFARYSKSFLSFLSPRKPRD